MTGRRDSTAGLRHPAWCDPAMCTADPSAADLDSSLASRGGYHRSAPIPVDLSTAIWLPERAGTVCLTEAAAPWPCAPYLRISLGQAELSMPVDAAGPVLAALSGLLTAARRDRAVTR